MVLSKLSALLLFTLAVLTTAEPVCDPETQYLLNGECCQLCKPGTSMVSKGECRSPECKGCDENEYMNTYNKEEMCKRQPYCDPNSNFEWPGSTSKTERRLCLCKEGFHCSSESCITCVPHTECEPGYGATAIGDQNRDTVCEKCPVGKFSDEKSWNGTCKEKTTCPGAVAKDGNSESDDECAETSWHVGVIAFAVLISLAIVIALVLLYKLKYKGKTGQEQLKHGIEPVDHKEACFDKFVLEDEEKRTPFITNPTDEEEKSIYHSGPTEETEESVYTANGHALAQDGKEHVVSQPETQENFDSGPCPYTD